MRAIPIRLSFSRKVDVGERWAAGSWMCEDRAWGTRPVSELGSRQDATYVKGGYRIGKR